MRTSSTYPRGGGPVSLVCLSARVLSKGTAMAASAGARPDLESESEEESLAAGEEESEGDECDESGMTEGGEWDPQVRREQRHAMRQIIREMQEERDDMSVPDDLVKNVKKLNSVFKDVVSTREAAIDAEGFQLLSAIGKELAETSAGELVFDPNVFAEKLVTFMGGRRGDGTTHLENLDWAKLGDKVAPCFKTPPSLDFLYGALDVEPIKTKQRQKAEKKKDTSEATVSKPRELKGFEEEEESTTKDVAHLFYHLKRICAEKGRVHYFTCLVDPESFSHTVENMFHFAFLVKDGRAGMEIDEEEDQPYIYIPRGGKSQRDERGQMVMSLSPPQWRRAIEKFGIETAMIPCRTD